MSLTITEMLRARNNILRKQGFVPSAQAAGGPDPSMGGGMPPGAPAGAPMGGPPGMPPGAPPMDPAAMGGMPPGAPPMDPAAMGGQDPSQMIAPDGTSPGGPMGDEGGGGGGKGGGGGVKVKPEDIVMLLQQDRQILAELKLIRDLLLDIMKQTNLQINPDTLRSSVAAAGDIVSPQQTGGVGGVM